VKPGGAGCAPCLAPGRRQVPHPLARADRNRACFNRTVARSSQFNEQSPLIIGAIRTGLTLAEACARLGVNMKTVRTWMHRRPEFRAALDAARAQGEATEPRSSPMTEQEFREHLDAAVRKGVVGAMKLWAGLHLREAQPPPAAEDPFDAAREQRLRVIRGDG
jgi:hypothetical protein